MKQIVSIFIFVFTIPIFTFGQTNFKDELGKKQGLYIDTLKYGEIYERTYKNDTLHGFYRKSTKNGTVLETGFYKNGLKDSLWVDFHKYGTLVKVTGYYKNGIKDSLWIETYMDGSWKTGYYKNGNRDSLWLEFYENGNIKSKIEYANGGYFSGQRYYFSINGDTLFPRVIEPKLLPNIMVATNDETLEEDTLIINNTDLKVYLLFDTKDSLNRFFCHGWADVYGICLNDYLTICAIDINIKVSPVGIKIYDHAIVCNKKLKVNGFGTNGHIKKLNYGDDSFSKKCFKSRLGEIEVYRKRRCMDTGRNPIKITRNGKTLLFNDIGNLIFFEFDSDNDGKKELYILSYFSCEGRLECYKVDDK